MVDEEVLDRVHPDVDVHLSQTAIKLRSDDEKDNAPKEINDADVDREKTSLEKLAGERVEFCLKDHWEIQ